MYSRFFYLFIIALVAATPAVAADDVNAAAANTTSTAAPATNTVKSEEAEPPPEESRVQVPDTPHQEHLGEKGEKPAKPDEQAAAKPHDGAKISAPETLRVSLTPEPKLEKDKQAAFVLRLEDKKGHPVGESDLEVQHTQKMHLLIVDESFTDYQHVHPVPALDSWSFSFTPRTAHNYKIWVDVKPRGGDEEMLPLLLKGKEPCKVPCADATERLTAAFGDDKATLSFDAPLQAGTPATATLALTDKKGAPLKDLQPVMGAYAHVAAFTGDFSGVAHVHPQGKEPADDKDRGASPLTFMIHPEKPGLLKLFVEIRRDDKNVFLYFTAKVAATGKQPAPDASKKP